MPIEQAPVRLPGTVSFDTASRTGARYRILVSVPPRTPPASGFPVLYLLDGNATFATAAGAAAVQSRRPEVTGVPDCVVVGIGYPTDEPFDQARRRFDYTPPCGAGTPADSGGADRFLSFIEMELKPAIEAMVPVDRRAQALFGHSFGGLFVLWCLFTSSDSFQSYITASPSIWWSQACVLAHEPAFVGRMKKPGSTHRLLVTVGGLEPRESVASPRDDGRHRMVDDAAALAARLSEQCGERLRVAFVEFADENHASVIPAAISRSLRFAWSHA